MGTGESIWGTRRAGKWRVFKVLPVYTILTNWLTLSRIINKRTKNSWPSQPSRRRVSRAMSLQVNSAINRRPTGYSFIFVLPSQYRGHRGTNQLLRSEWKRSITTSPSFCRTIIRRTITSPHLTILFLSLDLLLLFTRRRPRERKKPKTRLWKRNRETIFSGFYFIVVSSATDCGTADSPWILMRSIHDDRQRFILEETEYKNRLAIYLMIYAY